MISNIMIRMHFDKCCRIETYTTTSDGALYSCFCYGIVSVIIIIIIIVYSGSYGTRHCV